MNLDELIIPECFVDTTLAETLVYPKKGYNHTYGCNDVLSKISTKFADKAALGIIDDDDVVPKTFHSFTLLKKHSDNLSIYKQKDKPHYNKGHEYNCWNTHSICRHHFGSCNGVGLTQ